MKIRTSLPITRIKHINQPKSPEIESPELTPIEKYKEVQKQDWQIEALIIGSIILGLTQIPDLMNRYYLEFADVFGIKATGIEMMLNIPFAFLLINMLIVLFIRAIWIIEAFGSRNIDRMNELNEMAGAYFGSGILYFLVLLSGAVFWTFLNYIFSITYILFVEIAGIYSSFSVAYFVIRLFPSQEEFRIKLKWFILITLLLVSPLVFILLRNKWRKLSHELFFKFQDKYGKKALLFEYTFLVLIAIYINYLFLYTGFFGSSNRPMSVTSKNSPIIVEDEKFSDKSLWLFVHSSAIDKIRNKSKNFFGEDEILEKRNYQDYKTLPDIRKIRIYVNGKLKTHTWRLNFLNVGAGVKTYLRDSEMKKGFNDIRIKTYREGRWSLWDFSVYKP